MQKRRPRLRGWPWGHNSLLDSTWYGSNTGNVVPRVRPVRAIIYLWPPLWQEITYIHIRLQRWPGPHMQSHNQPHSHEQRSIHHMATHCEKMYRILRVLLVMATMTWPSTSRVDIDNKRPTETKVAVWWPNRKVKSHWNAMLVPEEVHPHCTWRQRNAKRAVTFYYA